MKENLILYHYWRSSCSWRVRWALNHKNVKYTAKAVDILAGEQNSAAFLAKNPFGYVPALETPAGVFGESLAILEWIEETYPKNPLLPSSSSDRLQIRQICQMIASGIQPVQNLSVMRRHSSDPVAQSQWGHHWIQKGFDKLELVVSKTAGTYCFGGTLTFADVCLVPQVFNANRFKVDMDQYPTLKRINAHCLTLKSCDAAAPHNQPGAR